MTIALVENGEVKQIRSDDLTDIPEHKRGAFREVVGTPPSLQPGEVAIGPTYTLTEPTVTASWTVQTVVPQSVTPYQARKAINDAGLRSAVEAAVAAGSQDGKDAWEYATEIRRDSPFIAALAPALNLTDAQIDALFISASQAN